MGYIDSYKHLEKLCSELFGNNKGVSAYIDEMLSLTDGKLYVKNWNEDLEKLKHYRWVRNRIVHEPGCTENNMCTAEDEKWINDFYSRIISCTDPLALYRRVTKNPSTPVSYMSLSETFYDIDNDEDYFCASRKKIALVLISLAVAAFLSIMLYQAS